MADYTAQVASILAAASPPPVAGTGLYLPDAKVGDDYALVIAGTLLLPTALASAILMLKVSPTDPDPGVLSATITPVGTANGQIVQNGATGPYSLILILTPAQTLALAPGTYHLEVRLVGAAGDEYTAVHKSYITFAPRLIAAP